MKIISHDDILKLNINPEDCFNWVNDMLLEKADVILPAKISMKPEDDIFYNVMPSILPKKNAAGVKVVTRYPSRIPSLDSQIMLYDLETGKTNALMDGNFITTMRTGAVAAHSIQLLAKKNYENIAFIGLGNQARSVMKVLSTIINKRKIKLKLMKYKDQHILFENFVRNLPGTENITYEYCDSYDSAIKNSDVIVSSVTYFESDICEDNCYDKGCLLVPIHTRGFMNCDLFFDKVFADDKNHVTGFKYFDKFKEFAEISDILSGKNKGRTNDEERIIAYNIGLSMHDIYFAKKIFDLAKEKGIGTAIDLYAPKDKFWLD